MNSKASNLTPEEPVRLPDLEQSERIRHYVLGQLDAAQCTEFECELLGSQSLQEQVEAEFALREGAAGLAEFSDSADSTDPLGPGEAKQVLSAVPTWLRMAAVALLGVGVGIWVGDRNAETPGAMPASWVSMSSMRSGGDAVGYSAKAEQAVAIRFLTANVGKHDLRVSDRDDRLIAELRELSSNERGELFVVLPPMRVAQSPVQLELVGSERHDRYRLQLN